MWVSQVSPLCYYKYGCVGIPFLLQVSASVHTLIGIGGEDALVIYKDGRWSWLLSGHHPDGEQSSGDIVWCEWIHWKSLHYLIIITSQVC